MRFIKLFSVGVVSALLVGIILLLMAYMPGTSHISKEILSHLGSAGIGYSTLVLGQRLVDYARQQLSESRMDRYLEDSVLVLAPPKNEFSCIGVGVDGGITPADRRSIDLRKLARLRAYYNCLRHDPERKLPRIIICTARSQGYVELLCQVLGIASTNNENLPKHDDIPFVIENGAAIYFPVSKNTECLLTDEERSTIEEVREILHIRFGKTNMFEPKSYMVTMNKRKNSMADSDHLLQEVTLLLKEKDYLEKVSAKKTNTSIDISIKNKTKAAALEVVMDRAIQDISFNTMAYIAETPSDEEIVGKAKISYCSDIDATQEVIDIVEETGNGRVVKEKDIDLLQIVIEECTGVSLGSKKGRNT